MANVEPIPHEPTRYFVKSATRPDYTFVVDSNYEDGWSCGCEQFMVRGKSCPHIRKVLAEIMSKTKFPRQLAMDVAAIICRELKPLTERLIVAGSLRRRKREVGDIEILYIPKYEERQAPEELLPKPIQVNLVDEYLNRLLREGAIARRSSVTGSVAWGEKNKLAVWCADGIPVDLFSATEANWFNYLVCRTGSAENNLAICNAAIARGLKWNPYGVGFSYPNGNTIEVKSEQDVFLHAGLEYKEPCDR